MDQRDAHPLITAAINDLLVMIGVIIGIFSGQSKITVSGRGTAGITTSMNKNVNQTLELFQII